MHERSGKKGCRLLVWKEPRKGGRADRWRIRLKLCSRLLTLDEERARRTAVILFEDVVDKVRRNRDQVDDEGYCGQETDSG